MNRNRIYSPREIQDLIAQDRTIVISENRVLRLDGWLARHPGGKLAIQHMVGRDATNEINIYHSEQTLRTMDKYRIGRVEGTWTNMTPPIRGGVYTRRLGESDSSATASEDDSISDDSSSASTVASSQTSIEDLQPDIANPCRKRVKAWTTNHDMEGDNKEDQYMTAEAYAAKMVQKEIDNDFDDFPPLDPQTQGRINDKYQLLHERIKREGFYDCPYRSYGKECLRYSALFAMFVIALRAEWYITSSAFLGLFWHQIMFTAHDGGHMAITHNFVIDTLIAMFVADFCCGLSIGWWKSSHNVHHLITNHPEHDPDIQNVPLLATSPSFFQSLHSSYYKFTFVWGKEANIAARFQHYTYYPIMAIARFNLYLLSWLHLLSPRSIGMGAVAWTKPTEILFMTCYWFLFGYCLLWRSIPTWTLRVAFVLVSHIITMGLHVQITLSHFAMSTADLGDAESFPQRQLRTTMDVDCPRWLDFIHGGLQFQAIHHLFPRVPRHNLRKLQGLVMEFCEEVGLEYKVLSFADGNRKVIGRLGEVAGQVEMLVKCQKYMAETGESGLH